MKTNVIMESGKDRNLFGVVIRQETKSGFMNLSDLQESYNKQATIHGWNDKFYRHLLFSTTNMERIYYLAKDQNLTEVSFLTFMEMVENETPAKLLKKLNLYKQTGARKTNTVWAHPSIFVLLAMEMNPMFYAKVVSWLSDKLILNRIEAGNFYKALSSSISKWNPDGNQYITLAKALNYIIFNKHEPGIRNQGSAKQLKELEDLEKKMSFAIDMGYITSFDMLLKELRKLYTQRSY